jgi:transcriptional regulator with XRE-family HTH domain
MDIRTRFGRNVRSLRRAADLSQDEFADLAGVHRTYMSGIERGTRAPTIIVVERIAAALKVEPGDLFR